jgi:hypothetical protein
MPPYIAFLLLLLGGLVFTAALSNIMDSRVAEQELRRELTNEATNR